MTADRISPPSLTMTKRSSSTIPGSGLEPDDACAVGVHLIRAEALRESGTVPVIEPFTLATWLKFPLAVVGAKDDTDDRLR